MVKCQVTDRKFIQEFLLRKKDEVDNWFINQNFIGGETGQELDRFTWNFATNMT